MAYATSKQIEASQIPVIDVAGLRSGSVDAMREVADSLARAAHSPGFFYVANHGVPTTVLERALALSREFFALPTERKLEVAVSGHHRGFLRVGEAKMYGGAHPDLKESFVFGLDVQADDPIIAGGHPMIGPNRWPAALPRMRGALNAFFDSMSGCAVQLMGAFAVAMGLPSGFFVQHLTAPVSRGSIIYYPPQPAHLGEEQFGVAPHTDYGCLTLLWQDATGGLEVRSTDGEWVTAQPIENTLVVNVGDLLARWTNDRFRSTAHRVVNRSGAERYSMALFFDPDADTLIDPRAALRSGETPRYEPTTCAAHILGRYGAAFRYRDKPPA